MGEKCHSYDRAFLYFHLNEISNKIHYFFFVCIFILSSFSPFSLILFFHLNYCGCTLCCCCCCCATRLANVLIQKQKTGATGSISASNNLNRWNRNGIFWVRIFFFLLMSQPCSFHFSHSLSIHDDVCGFAGIIATKNTLRLDIQK